jgi:phospholipid/cholesterol/gamma-HCH transport system substrate-binding protein
VATRAQKTKVGLFLIVCTAVLIGILLLVARLTTIEYDPYIVEFHESVLGLSQDSTVVYVGVPIGKVGSITVTDSGSALVTILVQKDNVTLYEGVTARLQIQSLALGTMIVGLQGGDPSAPRLEPGSRIPAEKSLFEDVSMQAGQLIERLDSILLKVDRSLEGMQPGDLAKTIDEAQGLLVDARTFLNTTRGEVESLSARVDTSMEQLDGLLADARGAARNFGDAANAVKDAVEPLDLASFEQRLSQQLDSLSGEVESALQTFDSTAKTVAHGADNVEFTLRETLRQLNETLASMKELTDYLRQDPSSVIRGRAGARQGGR